MRIRVKANSEKDLNPLERPPKFPLGKHTKVPVRGSVSSSHKGHSYETCLLFLEGLQMSSLQ